MVKSILDPSIIYQETKNIDKEDIDFDRVHDAAHKAQLQDVIDKLPNNYKAKLKRLKSSASGVFLCLAYKGSIVGENCVVKYFYKKKYKFYFKAILSIVVSYIGK